MFDYTTFIFKKRQNKFLVAEMKITKTIVHIEIFFTAI